MCTHTRNLTLVLHFSQHTYKAKDTTAKNKYNKAEQMKVDNRQNCSTQVCKKKKKKIGVHINMYKKHHDQQQKFPKCKNYIFKN